MSIYASLQAPDSDHVFPKCAKWVKDHHAFEGAISDEGSFGFDDSKECTCGQIDTPLVYQGSHVLPSDDDERGGWIDLACIPGHVRYYRDNPDAPTAEEPEWPNIEPYMRFGVNGETVVLTERHVRQVHKTLGEWLEARESARIKDTVEAMKETGDA